MNCAPVRVLTINLLLCPSQAGPQGGYSSYAAVHHDGGIVYVRGRPAYVLVVLTRGLQDQAASAALIADLARLVHVHAVPAR